LSVEHTRGIAELLEKYRWHKKRPEASDYGFLHNKPDKVLTNIRHDSDYFLSDNETRYRYLVDLKIGGDLDNKKAHSKKAFVNTISHTAE